MESAITINSHTIDLGSILLSFKTLFLLLNGKNMKAIHTAIYTSVDRKRNTSYFNWQYVISVVRSHCLSSHIISLL